MALVCLCERAVLVLWRPFFPYQCLEVSADSADAFVMLHKQSLLIIDDVAEHYAWLLFACKPQCCTPWSGRPVVRL